MEGDLPPALTVVGLILNEMISGTSGTSGACPPTSIVTCFIEEILNVEECAINLYVVVTFGVTFNDPVLSTLRVLRI